MYPCDKQWVGVVICECTIVTNSGLFVFYISKLVIIVIIIGALLANI
jgi:hypothetical protein